MNGKISSDELQVLFLAGMKKSPHFSFISGTQPFKIRFCDKEYFVYIKNLSSAYFKNRPDVTRAQLPVRDEFDFIKQSDIPFVFLGYDSENDVYICWDYNNAKRRLNVQGNVSFYSRQSLQNKVQESSFLQSKLKNGEDIVLFKRRNLIDFFTEIESFFSQTEKTEVVNDSENDSVSRNGKLYKIDNPVLLEKLKPLLAGTILHTLEAIQITQNFYKDEYPAMSYKDWSNLVKGLKF